MCVRNLRIKSNKLDFNPIIDRYYNYVPCGYCEECLETKRQDLVTRLSYHYDYIRSIGGCAYYFTLTYDERSLPRFKSRGVFNRSHVKSFIDNLRHCFCSGSSSYCMSSEYGDEGLRPHYHFVWFLKYPVSISNFHDFVNFYWPYGNVNWSKNEGLISGYRCFQYVSKYVNKDSRFVSVLASKKYFSEEDCSDFVNFKATLFRDLEIMPFSLHSNGIGLSMLSSLTFRNFVDGFVYRNDDNGISKKVMIPLYILRKALKYTYINLNGNVSYQYTPFGFEVLKARLLLKADQADKEFQLYMKQVLPTYNINFSIKSKFAYDEVSERLEEFNSNFTCRDLALYSVFYRGLNFQPTNSFVSDLETYVSFQLMPTPSDYAYFHSNDLFEDMLLFLTSVKQLTSYDLYVKKQSGKRARQLLLSAKTGKKKYVPLKDFSHYVNFKNDNSCLSILLGHSQSRREQKTALSRFLSL